MKQICKRSFAFFLAVLMLATLCACQKPAPAGKQVTLGTWQNGTYTNTYAGFACALAENWNCQLAGAEQGDAPVTAERITDLKADNEETLSSLHVQYRKHSAELLQYYQTMTSEQLVDAVLESKDEMIKTYEESGILVTSMEKVQVTFAGQECFALRTQATIQDVPYYTTQIFVFGEGLYGVTLTAASFETDKTADLLAMFTAA